MCTLLKYRELILQLEGATETLRNDYLGRIEHKATYSNEDLRAIMEKIGEYSIKLKTVAIKLARPPVDKKSLGYTEADVKELSERAQRVKSMMAVYKELGHPKDEHFVIWLAGAGWKAADLEKQDIASIHKRYNEKYAAITTDKVQDTTMFLSGYNNAGILQRHGKLDALSSDIERDTSEPEYCGTTYNELGEHSRYMLAAYLAGVGVEDFNPETMFGYGEDYHPYMDDDSPHLYGDESFPYFLGGLDDALEDVKLNGTWGP